MSDIVLKPVEENDVDEIKQKIGERETQPKKPRKKRKKKESEPIPELPSFALIPFCNFASDVIEKRFGEKWKLEDDEKEEFSKVSVNLLNKYLPDIVTYQEELAFCLVVISYVGKRRYGINITESISSDDNSRKKRKRQNDSGEKVDEKSE